MDKSSNSLNWFEIPVTDISRAKNFYQNLFDISLEESNMEDAKMAFFPWEMGSGKATGALVQSPNHKPSMDGSLVYLNANPSMDKILNKVEAAGGQIVVPKTQIGEHGYIAFMKDSEGNKVGIHSMA